MTPRGDTVVCVVNGEEDVRQVAYMEMDPHSRIPNARPIPVLQPGEEVRWCLGDARPWIIQTQVD